MIEGSVFFAAYGGGHVAALAPVIWQLNEARHRTSVMGFTTARDTLERAGIDAIGVADVLPLVPAFAHAPVIGAALAAGQGRHPLVSEAETNAYLGVGYIGLEQRHGAAEAARIWARSGRQAFQPTSFFEDLFTRSRPLVVVATNSPRSERAALEAARNLGIPSLCVVDLYAAFEIEWCGARGYASRVCVLNDEVRRRFIAQGSEPARVVATGNPAFDRLGELNYAGVRQRKRAQLGLAEADRLILWISQVEPAEHPFSGAVGDPTLSERIDKHLAATYCDDPRVHLVMRLHPSEDRPPAVQGPRIRYGDRSEPLDELLCASDCVLTCSSTVGVEASLLGVPVIQMMDSIFSPDLPLQEMGMAVAVPSYREVGPAIDEILSGPVRTGDPAASAGVRFGAAQRIVGEILSLTQ